MGNPNWKNRTLFKGDNLHVMRGMNSESVDLIYLDPPFNTNRIFAAPMGSKAAGASFDDMDTVRKGRGMAVDDSPETSRRCRRGGYGRPD